MKIVEKNECIAYQRLEKNSTLVKRAFANTIIGTHAPKARAWQQHLDSGGSAGREGRSVRESGVGEQVPLEVQHLHLHTR